MSSISPMSPRCRRTSGLKHTDDPHDARWLAHLLRLGGLPTGPMYPKADRPLRDLLRTCGPWVRQKPAVVLSLHSLLARLTGQRCSLHRISQLAPRPSPRSG